MVEERFRLRTRDIERDGGATDGTVGRMLVGRGSSVDRHSQFVRQLALHFPAKNLQMECAHEHKVAFYREPRHLPHLARHVEVCPDGVGEVASRGSSSIRRPAPRPLHVEACF